MKHVVLGVTLSVLVGCDLSPMSPQASAQADSRPASYRPLLAFFSNPPQALASFAGAYNLTIEVSEACRRVPLSGKVRGYEVLVHDTPLTYLLVKTFDGSLAGDLWTDGVFRWNGDEMHQNCACSETIASAPYCLWGQGLASARGDGVSSGILGGGVDVGAEKCYASHHFELRRKL
jgi:hypothetical protein